MDRSTRLAVLSPLPLSTPNTVALNTRVLLYSILLAMLTGVLFGLAPVLTSLRTDVQQALKEGGRGTTGQAHRLRGLFVIAQCTLTVVLLVEAGLLLRSFIRLQAQDPGLNADNLLTMRVSLPTAAYQEPERRVRFFEEAVTRLERLPGVRSASATAFLPFTGDGAGTGVRIAGQPAAQPGRGLSTVVRVVLPGYFETMGIAVLQGRSFTREDNSANVPLRYIVNRSSCGVTWGAVILCANAFLC